MEILKTIPQNSYQWIMNNGLSIVGILIGAFILRIVLSKVIEKTVRRAIGQTGQHLSKEAEEKRENTLIKILNGTLKVVVWIFAVMMILSNVGVEIGPLLAAAGIAGVAIGFGGQYLIRDLISGFFIIIENQYRVGDAVSFGEINGVVEDISLRMTTLRDLDGIVHHIPHGEITKVSNLSKGFSRVNLNVGVAYESDLEKVIEVINKVGLELAEDPEWKDKIKSEPKFLRVDNLGDSSIELKILGDTNPMAQWAVTGELRKRLKSAFDKEGISMPYPQRTISYLNGEK